MRRLILLLFPALLSAQSAWLAVGNPSTYVDSTGQAWAADNAGACSGTQFYSSTNVTGTADPTLYQYGRQANNMSCTFSEALGLYMVRLKFADVLGFTVPGQQIFNIYINGTLQQANFDIFNIVRAQNVAYDYVVPLYAQLQTGNLVIQVQQVQGGAQLQAISIIVTGASAGGATKLTGSGVLTAGSIPDGACIVPGATIPLAGAVVGDPVTIGTYYSPLLSGLYVTGNIITANQATVQICNLSGIAINPGSPIYTAIVVH